MLVSAPGKFRKTREGWNCRFQKTSRTEGRHKVQPSVDPTFPAGLPFPVPEILEFMGFRDSGKFFQQFSRNFPGTFLQNSRKDPRNSHSLLEFSDKVQSRSLAEILDAQVANEIGCDFKSLLFNRFSGDVAAILRSTLRLLIARFCCESRNQANRDLN